MLFLFVYFCGERIYSMRRILLHLSIPTLLLSFISVAALSQPDQKQIEFLLKGISTSELESHIQFLASDGMAGRKPGTEPMKLVADYLKQEFVQCGLESPSACDEPYIQWVTLTRNAWDVCRLSGVSDTLTEGINMVALGPMIETDGNFSMVFAGYGITQGKYDDYKDIDPNGKVVAYLTGDPTDREGRSLITGSKIGHFDRNTTYKDSLAYAKGAVATVRIDLNDMLASRTVKMYQRFRTGMQFGLPGNINDNNVRGTLYTGIHDIAGLYRIDTGQFLRELKRWMSGKKTSLRNEIPVTLTLLRGDKNQMKTPNLAGYIEGDSLKDELVVLTAHYDHLGSRDGSIYNGADDNASGTAALLEVAEAFGEALRSGLRPQRSVLFLPVTAEEMGLLGSQFYVENPLFPLENTLYCLNMDMIGRKETGIAPDSSYVYLYMSELPEPKLESLAQHIENTLQISHHVEYIDKTSGGFRTGGSDHVSFETAGIPVMYFFNGLHEDYHRPTDTVEKIDFKQLRNTSILVFSLLWAVANPG